VIFFKYAAALVMLLSGFAMGLFAQGSIAEGLPPSSPNIRGDADIDAFFLRMSSVYRCALPAGFYSQPMNAGDALAFIATVDSLDNKGKLSGQESAQLSKIKTILKFGHSLFSYTDAKRQGRVYAGFSLLDSSAVKVHDSTAFFTRALLRPHLEGSIGKFSFYSSIDVWTDHRSDSVWTESSYQPYDGVPYNLYGRADSSSTRSSDLPRGGIRYDGGVFTLEAAIDYLKQGPAVFNPLTFSGNAPPITFVRGTLDLGIFKYIQTVGQLKSQKDKPKFLYTHRLALSLFHSKLDAGITEVVINGSSTDQPHNAADSANALDSQYRNQTRTWEPVYMIPFVPYVFVEHYAGDRDNKALSFDASLHWPDNARIYGEFFIDDMTAPWSIFSSDWGNKWAYTIGSQYFGDFMNKDYSVTAEYTRVEPWVYTHFNGGSHRYDNFNQCLGAPLGPNSDALTLLCEAVMTPLHTVGVEFTNTRKDAAARGGSITDVFQGLPHNGFPADSWTKHFLGAGTVATTQLGAYWKFNQYGIFRATLKYDYDFSGESIFQLFGGLVF
jgi:hypothetical protein